MIASLEDAEIVTILGSCVAVCLGDRSKHIGGMNHFQMPGGAETYSEPLRYGPSATRALYDRIVELGGRRQRMQAKVFGGASILRGSLPPPGGLGCDNAAAALRTLAELGIPVVASDLGGHRARKLVYRIKDGSAWLRPIRRALR
jgi:chemotaxis protein CheD